MEEQWINKMRQKMETHEEPAPQGLWDDIESALGRKKPAPVPLYKNVYLWASAIGAAAAVIAVAFFVGNHAPKSLAPISNPDENVLAASEQPDMLSHEATATSLNEETTKYLAMTAPQTSAMGNRRSVQAAPLADGLSQKGKEVDEDKVDASEMVAEHRHKQKVNSAPRPQRKNGEKQTQKMIYERRFSVQEELDKSNRPTRFTAGFYAANLPHSSAQLNDYGEFVTGTTLPNDMSGHHYQEHKPAHDIIYSNLGKKVKTHKKHKLPIKLGVSFRYHFTDRLSLESGINYTYLGAELTSGTNKHYYVTEQNMQYLGVPLNLSYDVWKNRRWNLYATVGGAIDKCIRGRSETEYFLNNKKVSTEKESIMEKPVQFSVNGAVGAQLNLLSRVGLYAEPGVVYYFDNGSPIETIYKDKPFNFNFKLGLRISLK